LQIASCESKRKRSQIKPLCYWNRIPWVHSLQRWY
jgi:hypothetical protein